MTRIRPSERVIERVARLQDSTETQAVVDAPEDIRGLAEAVKKIPAQGDLTLSRCREIAAPLDSAVSWRVNVDATISVEAE